MVAWTSILIENLIFHISPGLNCKICELMKILLQECLLLGFSTTKLSTIISTLWSDYVCIYSNAITYEIKCIQNYMYNIYLYQGVRYFPRCVFFSKRHQNFNLFALKMHSSDFHVAHKTWCTVWMQYIWCIIWIAFNF